MISAFAIIIIIIIIEIQSHIMSITFSNMTATS